MTFSAVTTGEGALGIIIVPLWKRGEHQFDLTPSWGMIKWDVFGCQIELNISISAALLNSDGFPRISSSLHGRHPDL